jgi:hypothetical protein
MPPRSRLFAIIAVVLAGIAIGIAIGHGDGYLIDGLLGAGIISLAVAVG